MGFLSKLVAEAVEEMSMKQVEAVRATGASFLSLIVMGVMPQVLPRVIGFCAYLLDSNLRNSALVGFGRRRRHRRDPVHRVPAFRLRLCPDIVLAIIAIVMVGEILSGFMRRLFQ